MLHNCSLFSKRNGVMAMIEVMLETKILAISYTATIKLLITIQDFKSHFLYRKTVFIGKNTI